MLGAEKEDPEQAQEQDQGEEKEKEKAKAKAKAKEWLYIDEQKQTQGPFASSLMRAWYAAGYFNEETQVCAYLYLFRAVWTCSYYIIHIEVYMCIIVSLPSMAISSCLGLYTHTTTHTNVYGFIRAYICVYILIHVYVHSPHSPTR